MSLEEEKIRFREIRLTNTKESNCHNILGKAITTRIGKQNIVTEHNVVKGFQFKRNTFHRIFWLIYLIPSA